MMAHTRLLLAVVILVALASVAQGESILFSGYTWEVRGAGKGGPGPNHWDPANAWVDTNGFLHLRLSQRDGKWFCAEVFTRERLGFGRYEFEIQGQIDRLDPNVVFGLFNYPTSDTGRDATHEIDIEFAKWGCASAPIGNYTVWPVATNLTQQSKTFAFSLASDVSTHTFAWSGTNVSFRSTNGPAVGAGGSLADWLFQPESPLSRISQRPMPVHLNLWCFKGLPPSDGRELEVIIRSFKFTPL